MKIAHVLSSLNFGGQERVAFDLAVGQATLNHEVVTFSLDNGDGPLGASYASKHLEVVGIQKKDHGFDWAIWKTLAREFQERGIDVVHTHNPMPLFYASLPAKRAGARLVHTKHGINPTSRKRRWLRRGFGLAADAFVCVSESTALVAKEQFECRPSRLHTILNGTDFSRFGQDTDARQAIRSELSIPSQAIVIGTVGRIYREKAHPFLIRSVLPLLSKDVQLIIVGDGPERKALEAMVRASPKRDFIHLLGLRNDIPQVMASMDTFVLSSLYEGLPIVLLEAMATSLAVVSTAVGGVPKLIEDGRTGFLVESGDEAALRTSVAKLIDDAVLRMTIGGRGREMAVKDYSSTRMVNDYMRLYRGEG